MTPDALAVERDRLLEGGRTLEQVERMQRAADGRIELAVLLVDAWLSAKFVHLDLTGDMADDATIAAAQSHIEELAQGRLAAVAEFIAEQRALTDPGCDRLAAEVEQRFRETFVAPEPIDEYPPDGAG